MVKGFNSNIEVKFARLSFECSPVQKLDKQKKGKFPKYFGVVGGNEVKEEKTPKRFFTKVFKLIKIYSMLHSFSIFTFSTFSRT